MKKILMTTAAVLISMPAFAMDGHDHAHDAMMKKDVMVEKAMESETMMEKDAMKDKMMDQAMGDEAMVDKPEVYVAAFHADWCGSCKELGPKLGEAVSGFDAKDLQVVKFDLTDDKTTAASVETAAKHQWSDIYSEYGPKTGFALMIDGETNEVLGKISSGMSVDEIKAEIQKNI